MRFEVLTAVDIHVIVIWTVAVSIPVGQYHHVEDHAASNFSIQVSLVWKRRGYIGDMLGMCNERQK
jgi:hypothetical protein